MRRLRFLPFILILLLACFLSLFFGIPSQAASIYGPASKRLSLSQRFQYSARLLWYDGLLTRPLDLNAKPQPFKVEQGESVNSIANRLEEDGFISDADMFRTYLIYTGLDTTIQSGDYQLSAAMSIVDVARKLQDATPAQITFAILPGWRMDEIAASLPTSGLSITPDQFLAASSTLPEGFDFLEGATTVEGFLYPDSYILPREISANDLINDLVRNFALHLTSDIRNGFNRQGLTVYQGVILASMVQREAVHEEEQPLIASVFLNRLKIGMKLDSDPTVQYALGYNDVQGTWWKNPLSAEDLEYNSVFNTYIYKGLPPAPIANPSLNALRAAAYPAETPYYYFRAKCDGSGFHNFAATLEEQIQNACQ